MPRGLRYSELGANYARHGCYSILKIEDRNLASWKDCGADLPVGPDCSEEAARFSELPLL